MDEADQNEIRRLIQSEKVKDARIKALEDAGRAYYRSMDGGLKDVGKRSLALRAALAGEVDRG